MSIQTTNFHDTCARCPIQAAQDGEACYACVVRTIYQTSDFPCCSVCRMKLEGDGTCAVCSERTFDGEPMLLDRLEVAGLGKTIQGENFRSRRWRYLGSGVSAYKYKRYSQWDSLYFPLRALFMRKLKAYLAEIGGAFDIIALVPTSSDLMPRLFADVARVHARIGLSGEFKEHLLVNPTGEKHGDDHVPPNVRWREFNRKTLYQLAPGAVVEGKRILLLDDIYKSGCSINLCAKQLKAAGAREVVGFTLCRWP